MVWINFIFNKIKFLIVNFIDIIRYICCSTRNRRNSFSDFVPLSSVGIVTNDNLLHISTDDDISMNSNVNTFVQPRNVQDYINQYRQQKCRQMSNEIPEEMKADFFQDMEPKIIRQKKLLVKQDEEPSFSTDNSRLSFTPVSPIAAGNELAAWEEMENTSNWDVDDENTDLMLKEKRRIEREKRIAENMKKRMDKDRNRIASKIS